MERAGDGCDRIPGAAFERTGRSGNRYDEESTGTDGDGEGL